MLLTGKATPEAPPKDTKSFAMQRPDKQRIEGGFDGEWNTDEDHSKNNEERNWVIPQGW